MAVAFSLLPPTSPPSSSLPPPLSSPPLASGLRPLPLRFTPPFAPALEKSAKLQGRRTWRASMGGATTGPASQYAKEMERIAAKEALLLSIKDAGGVDVLSPGTTTDIGRIDVNERIVNLERLSPTPRPTTSPLLEGFWQFKWVGGGSLGLFAARILLERFPRTFASIEELNLLILDGSAKTTARLKIFNSIGSDFTLTSKLTVEGPLRLKEEYMEGLLAAPMLKEGLVPVQLKSTYEQFLAAAQRLLDPVKEAISSGLKFPLTGTFQRQMLISYLDDEILIARDESGLPEVLVRLNGNVAVVAEPAPEYVS